MIKLSIKVKQVATILMATAGVWLINIAVAMGISAPAIVAAIAGTLIFTVALWLLVQLLTHRLEKYVDYLTDINALNFEHDLEQLKKEILEIIDV